MQVLTENSAFPAVQILESTEKIANAAASLSNEHLSVALYRPNIGKMNSSATTSNILVRLYTCMTVYYIEFGRSWSTS